MGLINNCENCYYFDSLINWNDGLYYQCMSGNKLWEKCDDYEELWKEEVIYLLNEFDDKEEEFEQTCMRILKYYEDEQKKHSNARKIAALNKRKIAIVELLQERGRFDILEESGVGLE